MWLHCPLRGRRPSLTRTVAVAFVLIGLLLVPTSWPPTGSPAFTAAVPSLIRTPDSVTPGACYESGIGAPELVSIPVGMGPTGLAYDSVNDKIFVTNGGSDNVTVIDGNCNLVVGSIPVGSDPQGAVFDPANGDVYVVNSNSSNVSVIDGGSDQVIATIPVQSDPLGVVFDPANQDLYVEQAGTAPFYSQSGNLTVINGTSNQVSGTIVIGVGLGGGGPEGVAYDAANARLYVADNYMSDLLELKNSAVVEVNSTTNLVTNSTTVGNFSTFLDCVAFDPMTQEIFACDSGNNDVYTMRPSTPGVLATVPVGRGPDAATFVPWTDAQMAVADGSANDVTFIDANQSTVDWSMPVGSNPDAIAYDYRNRGLYVANYASDNLTVYGALTPPPPLKYSITFAESGLPNGTSWTVTLRVCAPIFPFCIYEPENSTGPFIVFSEINGTYNVTAWSVYPYAVFAMSAAGGSFDVNGSNVEVSIRFAFTATTKFFVTGLPSGVPWSLNITYGPTTWRFDSEPGPGKEVQLFSNLTYAYWVAFAPPYGHWDTRGNVTVPVQGVTVNITIPTGLSATGVPEGTGYALFGVTIAIAVGAAAVVLGRRFTFRKG